MWSWTNDDPFGANAPNENPSGADNFTCNLRLPGQYFDKETNLHYNYFRDYDAGIGRYIQSDPMGLRGGINTYVYARANPLKYSDPRGLLVRGENCTDGQWAAVMAAEAKVRAKIATCVDCPDRERFKQRLDTLLVNCLDTSTDVLGNRNCGYSFMDGSEMWLTPAGFTSTTCGCLEATVVHEIGHTIGYNEEKTSNLDQRCFPCGNPHGRH